MPIPVVQTMDFNLLELLNPLAQNLAVEPAHKAGRFFFNTALGQFGISNGSAWFYLGPQGLDVEAVQDIVGALFAGSTDVTSTYDDANNAIKLSIGTGKVTNAMISAAAAITLDKLAETSGLKILTAAERTRLAGIATGATANQTDAYLLARANHTGNMSADLVVDGTTNKAFTATEKTKLTGVAAGATANATDAALRARSSHTGTQTADTISDFPAAVKAVVDTVIDGAPGTLDTLNELAAALGDDPNFAATVTAQIALKAPISSLAAVATSGSYNDLANKPLFQQAIGNGSLTSFVLTHNFNTRAVVVDVSLAATPFTTVLPQVDKTSANTVTVSFAVAPTAGQYLVTIQA